MYGNKKIWTKFQRVFCYINSFSALSTDSQAFLSERLQQCCWQQKVFLNDGIVLRITLSVAGGKYM